MANLTHKEDLAKDMLNVPFGHIIGGAFTAATDAQIQSSMVCWNFIRSVGFEGSSADDLGEPKMMNFMYDRPGGLMGMNNQKNIVSVPFLSLIPMPSLRIESLKVQFNVRLTQTTSHQMSFAGTTTGIGSTERKNEFSETTDTVAEASQGKEAGDIIEGETGKNEWKTTTSAFGMVTDQSSNKHGMTVSREYSMKITVHAVQDEIPAGTQRVMDILASLIEKKSGDVGMNELMSSAFNIPGGGGAAPAAAATAGGV